MSSHCWIPNQGSTALILLVSYCPVTFNECFRSEQQQRRLTYNSGSCDSPRSYTPSVNSTTKIFTHCFPQVSCLVGIQVCLIKGSRWTLPDYTGLKHSFVFSSLCDLFLNSMAYFHNPGVILQNLYPKKLQGMLIRRWLTCSSKIPLSKNSVFLFNMWHIVCCDLFPTAWNMQTIITILLHNILNAAFFIFMLEWIPLCRSKKEQFTSTSTIILKNVCPLLS